MGIVATLQASVDDVKNSINAAAIKLGMDPLLGIAVGQVESGLRADAVGDQDSGYPSYGVFQERLVVGRGGFRTPDPDPGRQAERFYGDVRRYVSSGGGGTPGQIAAAVQRPADPVGYAAKVDRAYGELTGSNGGVVGAPGETGGRGVPVTQELIDKIRRTLQNLVAQSDSLVPGGGLSEAEIAERLRAEYPNVPAATLQKIAYDEARGVRTTIADLPVIGGLVGAGEAVGGAVADKLKGLDKLGEAAASVFQQRTLFVGLAAVLALGGAWLYASSLRREGQAAHG